MEKLTSAGLLSVMSCHVISGDKTGRSIFIWPYLFVCEAEKVQMASSTPRFGRREGPDVPSVPDSAEAVQQALQAAQAALQLGAQRSTVSPSWADHLHTIRTDASRAAADTELHANSLAEQVR